MDTKVNHILIELKEKLLATCEKKENYEKTFRRKRKEQKEINWKQSQLVLKDLNANVDKLIKLYGDGSYTDGKSKEADHFLFQKTLSNIFNNEEIFTASLTDYTRKQFFGGISDLAGGGTSKTEYKMFDSSNSESFLGQDGCEDIKERKRLELERLQESFLKNKQICVNKEMSRVKYSKAVQIADRQLKLLNALNNFDVTDEQLAEKIACLFKEINVCQNKIRTCYGTDLFTVLQKLQKLNSTRVIQGDYDLKLMRQDYFISKQDEIIKQLLSQYSRNYLLALIHELDLKGHTQNYHIFSTLTTLISNETSDIEKRISYLKQFVTDVTLEKKIVTADDAYMNCIYETICWNKNDETELFRSFNDLNAAASVLSKSHNSKKNVAQNTEVEKVDLLKQIESTILDVETIMKFSKEKANKDLSSVMGDLEGNLSIAESQINEVIKDVMDKKTQLSVDRPLDMKRNVYVDFLNDASKLKRELNDLDSKVKSLTLSLS